MPLIPFYVDQLLVNERTYTKATGKHRLRIQDLRATLEPGYG